MANIVLSTPAAQRQGAVNNRVERAENQSSFLAAEGLAKLSEAVGDLERRKQGLKASADAAQMQAELSVWLKEQEASRKGKKGFETLASDFIEEKDKRLSALKEKNGSMYYREKLDEAAVNVFAGLVGQAENARINGEFREQQERLQGMIDAKNTVVMNDPSSWKEAAVEVENQINAAILPAETKAAMGKKARHNFAYTSALTDLKADPVKLKEDLEAGKYDGAFSAEEQFNYLSGAENNILKALLEGDTVEAEKYVKENKFTTIPEKAALEKIAAVRKANEKAVLEQDKIDRALFELSFWNDPSWGKLKAFDFRGDEKKKEKWEERLRQIPNSEAKTAYNSIDDISRAIDELETMSADTKEEQGKLIEKASDLTAAIGSMNAKGNLSVDDMRTYTASVGKIAVDGTLRKDLQAMRPQAEAFRSALKEANSIKNKKERVAARNAINRSQANAFFGITPSPAEKILSDGYAAFIKEIASGNKDTANMIYKDTLIAARNAMYPFLAGKEKGDAVVDDNGTVMVLAGFDGITPIVEGK